MRPKKNYHKMNDQRGYVLVTVGAGMVALLGFFALAVDLGHIFVTKSQLQNTADSAALAAVSEMSVSLDQARTTAISFGQSHWVADSQIQVAEEDVIFGNYDFPTGTFNANTSPENAVFIGAKRVDGSASGSLPLFFAPIFGQNFSDVQANSKAVLDPHVVGVQGKNRLIPYSVIDFVVDADNDGQFDIGETIDIHPRDESPGNFGFLDLDGGSNDTTELRIYIEEGYDSDFVIPPGGSKEVSGSTGITGNALLNSFEVILGEVVFLPVHDWVVNPGDNAIFNVIAILAVKIDSVKLTGAHHTRYIRTEIINYSSSVLVVDPNAPPNNSVSKPRLVQ